MIQRHQTQTSLVLSISDWNGLRQRETSRASFALAADPALLLRGPFFLQWYHARAGRGLREGRLFGTGFFWSPTFPPHYLHSPIPSSYRSTYCMYICTCTWVQSLGPLTACILNKPVSIIRPPGSSTGGEFVQISGAACH